MTGVDRLNVAQSQALNRVLQRADRILGGTIKSAFHPWDGKPNRHRDQVALRNLADIQARQNNADTDRDIDELLSALMPAHDYASRDRCWQRICAAERLDRVLAIADRNLNNPENTDYGLFVRPDESNLVWAEHAREYNAALRLATRAPKGGAS